MLTDVDSTNINNEDMKEFKRKNNLLNFVTVKKLKEKSAFLKIAAEVFQAGAFLNIFFGFWGFWGTFSYKNFSSQKTWFCC